MKTICIILGLLAGSCVANATNQAKSSPDKPVRLYVESYKYSEHAEVHPSGQGCNSDGTQTYSFQKDIAETWETHWADGVGGGASYDESSGNKTTGSLGDNSSSSTTAETYHWGNSDWPDLVEGTRTVDWAFTGNDGVTTPRSWSGTADPPSVARPGDSGGFLGIGYEHCAVKDSQPGNATWPDGSGGYKEAKDRVVYTRTAETVMKLFTGGKAVSKRKNLFMLSASAWRTQGMTLKPNLLNDTCYWEWDPPPNWGPTKQVDSTDIEIDGKPLGSDGKLWCLYEDNDTRDVTPRVKNNDYYTFTVGASRHTLKSYTWHPALTDTNRERSQVGVGEEVSVYLDPPLDMTFPESPWWTTSAGGIEPDEGSDIKFTAPSNAATANVRVYVRDVHLDKTFAVLEPSGVDHAIITSTYTNTYAERLAGAKMDLNVWIAPTSVSFYKVYIFEVGENAANNTGYFAYDEPPNYWDIPSLSHIGHGADRWVGPLPDNNLLTDTAGSQAFLPPWNGGGEFTWPIPAKWKVGDDGATNDLHNWSDQVFSMDANGTFSVTKFGKTVTRTTNNVVTPSL